ncbi:hypothetical protein [Brevundimonas naejangsanensis]
MRLDVLLEGSPAYGVRYVRNGVVLFRRSGFEVEFNEMASEVVETLSDQCKVILLIKGRDCERLFLAPLKGKPKFG